MKLHSLLIAGCAAALVAAPALGQYRQEDLRDFAAKAVADGTAVVTEPRFETVKNPDTGEKIYHYNLGSAVLVDPSTEEYGGAQPADPVQEALRQQLHVAVIRRYRNTPRQRQWWKPTLDAVEAKIAQMLDVAQDPGLEAEARAGRLGALREEIDGIYSGAMDRAAREVGAEARPSGHYAAGYHFVALSTRPDGRLYYLSAGAWDLFQLAKSRGRTVQQPEWNEVAQGQQLTLGGKYWFKATWDDGGVFRTDGPVAIRKSAPIEFTRTGFRVNDDE